MKFNVKPAIARMRLSVNSLRSLDHGKFFLIAAMIFGIVFIFLTPPVAGLDEEQHFYRAYQVSDLNIRSDRVIAPNVYGKVGEGYGGNLPASVYRDINKVRNSMNVDKSFKYRVVRDTALTPLEVSKKVAVRFDNTAIYSPVPYAPQAIGMNIGKIFNASPVILSYLGRITNLLAWTALLYLAIRLLPSGKWMMVVLALNPASLFLASSLSPDALAIALSALLVSVVLHFRDKINKITLRQGLLLAGLVCLVALSKNAYIPIMFLILLIPSLALRGKYKLMILATGLLAGLGWNALIFPIASGIPAYFSIGLHISTADQLSFIMHHPFNFIRIFLWNVLGMPSVVITGAFAGLVGDTMLPYWVSVAWTFTFIGAYATKSRATELKERVKNSLKYRIAVVSVLLATIMAIIMTLYVGWNAVGAKWMEGVQARYFIPVSFLLIPLLLAIKPPRILKVGDYSMAVKVLVIVILIATCLTMTVRYLYGI